MCVPARGGQHWVSSSVILYTTVFNFNFMCMSIFPYVYIYEHMCLVPEEAKKGVGPLRTRVTDGSKQPCRFWELNLAPLYEKSELLTPESSPQPLHLIFSCYEHF